MSFLLRHRLPFACFMFSFVCFGPKIVKGQTVFESSIPGTASITVTDGSGSQNEGLPGATVRLVEASVAAQTDVKGVAKLSAKSGNYTLLVSSIGYTEQRIKIQLQSGKTIQISIKLSSTTKNLGSVRVNARRRLVTEAGVLDDRRNSAISQDLISARQIEKTASITTTQALQRVAGVTITNDKYVSIRGLGDRNVIAQLNGSRLSSANADRNSVSLDLIPAALLDNIAVLKTITPDKPADAAAGIVELKTKSIPDSLILIFNAQTGANSTIGFGGDLNLFYNSDLGYFGQNVRKKNLPQSLLDLQQQFPPGKFQGSNTPLNSGEQVRNFLINSRGNSAQYAEALRINKLYRQFDPILGTEYRPATPNQIYSLSFGDRFVFGKQVLGVIAGLNYYHRSEARRDATIRRYSIYQGVGPIYPLRVPSTTTSNNPSLNLILNQVENTGLETLNYGGLAGLSYQPVSGQEVTLTYLGNKGAEAQGSRFLGSFPNTGQQRVVLNDVNTLRQEEQILNTFQARGKHKLTEEDLSPELSWTLSKGKSRQNNPDYRFTSVLTDSNQYSIPLQRPFPGSSFYRFLTGTRSEILAPGTGGLVQVYDPNSRAYRTLVEKNQNYTADLTIPFKLLGVKQFFKTGIFYLDKSRVYRENIQTLPGTPALNATDVNGDVNALVSFSRLGFGSFQPVSDGELRPVGYVYQAAKSLNNYSGSSSANAAYAMLDLNTSHWKLAGGVRFEKTTINGMLDTAGAQTILGGFNSSTILPAVFRKDFDPQVRYATKWRPYYSANLIYKPTPSVNIRAAYSNALARPELRELIPLTQYDPFQFAVISGNRNLQNQDTKNFDFRAEWFRASGEVFAVSLYAKIISNQLTKAFSNDSTGTVTSGYEFDQIKFFNDPNQGKIFGIELEARKSFDFISERLKHFFVGTNLLLANSTIVKNKERFRSNQYVDNYTSAKSTLIEQPAYSVNVSLDYDNPKIGTSLTANFNQLGERLIQVILTGEPVDIYDRPVPVLDLVGSQRIFKKWTIKGYAKNILNPPYKEVYTNYGNQGQYRGQELLRRKYYRGAEFTIGVTYSIF